MALGALGGGTCFGDSGGPILSGNSDTVLAVNSYVTNGNCAGVTYSQRIDIPEVLAWIQSFLRPTGDPEVRTSAHPQGGGPRGCEAPRSSSPWRRGVRPPSLWLSQIRAFPGRIPLHLRARPAVPVDQWERRRQASLPVAFPCPRPGP